MINSNVKFINKVGEEKTLKGNTVTLFCVTQPIAGTIHYEFSIGGRADEEMSFAGPNLSAAMVVVRNLIERA